MKLVHVCTSLNKPVILYVLQMPKGAVAAVAARMKQQRNVEKVRK